MRTLLVSGSGTGVGKTRVTAALAWAASRNGLTVQIVKPVQTGVREGETGDAAAAAEMAGLSGGCVHTLRQFPAPLAPLAAAADAGASLEWDLLLDDLLALPPVDLRLIEGAGGLAVPLGTGGRDWVEFAAAACVTAVVLVVPDILGAINQARLVRLYLETKGAGSLRGGVFLNAIRPEDPAVCHSTRAALRDVGVPVWGELGTDAVRPELRSPLAEWIAA